MIRKVMQMMLWGWVRAWKIDGKIFKARVHHRFSLYTSGRGGVTWKSNLCRKGRLSLSMDCCKIQHVLLFVVFCSLSIGEDAPNDNCAGIVEWMGNGYCDEHNNNEECGYDQGRSPSHVMDKFLIPTRHSSNSICGRFYREDMHVVGVERFLLEYKEGTHVTSIVDGQELILIGSNQWP